jgi:hypothetical protein
MRQKKIFEETWGKMPPIQEKTKLKGRENLEMVMWYSQDFQFFETVSLYSPHWPQI